MKKTFTLICLCLISLLTINSYGQGFKTPNASSSQTIIQEFGLGTITLKYSRPDMKGRKIFGTGTLQPYGEVWRTGANEATTIKFSDEVSIEGNKIPAGEYGFFTIPGKDEWTIILNKTANQWGAYTYKESDDFIRFKVKPTRIAPAVETFTMQFNNVFPGSCDLAFMWENTAVSVHLTTDYDGRVMAGIAEAMKGDKKPYYQAIMYYYYNNKDMHTALEWANELERDKNMPPFVTKVWKARVQLRLGDKAGAIATATEGVNLARGKNEEYVRLNEAVIAAAKK